MLVRSSLRYCADRIPALDGLRSIAALLILLTHLWRYPNGYVLLNRIASAGWLGVDLFFVLSGFLITRGLAATRDRPDCLRSFYLRRGLRIFPAYYLLLLLVLVALPAVSATTELATVRHEAVWYVFYLSNFALAAGGWQLFLTDVTWSLAVEEQFYLLWPVIVRQIRGLAPACFALIVALPLIRLALWEAGVNWRWLHMMMPLRADAFAWGALLALGAIDARRLMGLPACAVAVLVGGLILGHVLIGAYARDSMLVGTAGYSANAWVATALVALVLEDGRLSRWLSWPPLRRVGVVSYGIYLFHPLVSAAVGHFYGDGGGLVRSLLFLAITCVVSYVVAEVSFRFYETLFLRFKDRGVGVCATPQGRSP